MGSTLRTGHFCSHSALKFELEGKIYPVYVPLFWKELKVYIPEGAKVAVFQKSQLSYGDFNIGYAKHGEKLGIVFDSGVTWYVDYEDVLFVALIEK